MLSANVVLRFWHFQIGRELIHDSFSHHIHCVGSRFWRSLSLTEAESQDLHDNAAKPQLCWVRYFIFWCILGCWDVFISVGGRSQIGIASNICKLSAIFNEKWTELQLKSSKYCAGNTVLLAIVSIHWNNQHSSPRPLRKTIRRRFPALTSNADLGPALFWTSFEASRFFRTLMSIDKVHVTLAMLRIW